MGCRCLGHAVCVSYDVTQRTSQREQAIINAPNAIYSSTVHSSRYGSIDASIALLTYAHYTNGNNHWNYATQSTNLNYILSKSMHFTAYGMANFLNCDRKTR